MGWKNDKSKSHADRILDYIKSELRISKEGSVVIPFDLSLHTDLLISLMEFDNGYEEIDSGVSFRLLHNSISALFKSNSLDSSSLLAEFKRKCNQHTNSETMYVILTSVSVPKSERLKGREINGCKIRFYAEFPKKYSGARANIIVEHGNGRAEQDEYLKVVISTKSCDNRSAIRKCLEAFEIYRGLWQVGFQINLSLWHFHGGVPAEKLQIFRLGEVHTIHLRDGKSEDGLLWYESEFSLGKLAKIKEPIIAEKNFEKNLRLLKRTLLNKHVETNLKMFTQAMDVYSEEYRFLKLWAVIEQLVDSYSNDEIVKRVSFMYEDGDYIKAQLTALRASRNQHTHAGQVPENLYQKNFILAKHIQMILKFFMANSFKFENKEDACGFLSSTSNLDALKKSLNKAQNRVNFCTRK